MRKLRSFLKRRVFSTSRARYPVSLNEAVSPVFIIGSGRSGNTLLRRILTSGSELYIPPETYVLGRVIKQYRNNPSLKWAEQCNLALGTFGNSKDFETFPTPYLYPLYAKLVALPEDQRSLSCIVISFYEYMMKNAKPSAVRWGDKTPMNSWSLEAINDLLPNTKYVHIIRNGHDVVSSYIKLGRYNDCVEAGRRWVSAVNECHQFAVKYPNAVTEVRYEGLCQNPETIARSLCAFLNLTFSSDMISGSKNIGELGDVGVRSHYENVSNPISVSSIGKGLDTLDSDSLKRLNPIIARTMDKFGYNR